MDDRPVTPEQAAAEPVCRQCGHAFFEHCWSEVDRDSCSRVGCRCREYLPLTPERRGTREVGR